MATLDAVMGRLPYRLELQELRPGTDIPLIALRASSSVGAAARAWLAPRSAPAEK